MRRLGFFAEIKFKIVLIYSLKLALRIESNYRESKLHAKTSYDAILDCNPSRPLDWVLIRKAVGPACWVISWFRNEVARGYQIRVRLPAFVKFSNLWACILTPAGLQPCVDCTYFLGATPRREFQFKFPEFSTRAPPPPPK